MGWTEFRHLLKTLPEHEVYFVIEELGMLLVKTDLAVIGKQLTVDKEVKKKIDQTEDLLNFAILETKRFGVDDLPIDSDGVSVKDSSDKYKQWYRHWKNWQHEMPDESWKSFLTARLNKKDLTQFLPKETWIEANTG